MLFCFTKRSLRRLGIIISMAAMVVAPFSASAEEVKWPKRLVISTPASGVAPHFITLGLARTIEAHTPIERVIVQPMGGPAVWAPLMKKGDVDMALHSGPDCILTVRGEGAYKRQGPMPFIRTIFAGSMNLFMLYTVPGRGIKNMGDIKGKVIYTKSAGNPSSLIFARAFLQATGLKESDLKASLTMVNFREAVQDIIEGRVDGMFNPVHTANVMELTQATGDCLLIGPRPEDAEAFLKLLPEGYFLQDIPANSPNYKNPRALKNAPMFRNALYMRADIHPDIVYGIIKALQDNRSEWEPIHAQATDWGSLYLGAPAYHEGAIRWMKENGQWTEAADKMQEKRLSEIK